MFKSSVSQHFRDNKTMYIAGGLAIAALGLGYYFTKGSKGTSKDSRKGPLFSREYLGTPGVSTDLVSELNDAIKTSVEYDVKLWLIPETQTFKGVADITFSVSAEYSNDLFLSAHTLKIQEVLVNDHPIDNDYFNDVANSEPGFLRISSNHLNKEKFKLTIKYSGDFGSLFGLVGFTDLASETQEQYVFTSTGLVGTSAIFPIIEAPNIRCVFRLSVAAPKSWRVFSNEKADDPTELRNFATTFSKSDKPDPDRS